MIKTRFNEKDSIPKNLLKKPLKVIPDENPAEIIAGAIVEVARGMAAINKTRLTRKTIVTLIHANSNVNKKEIELVLKNLEELEHNWLKK